jgi:hypothetical protein
MRFSIDRYQQLVRRIEVDDLDIEHAFAERPLSPDVAGAWPRPSDR